MRYARLTPGPGFRPVNSFLYYLQRLVVPRCMRQLCIGIFRKWIRVRRGHGAPVSTHGQHEILRTLDADGYAPLGTLLTDRQCDDIHDYFADKLLSGRDDGASGYTIGQVPANARMGEYSLRDIVGSPHILELANNRKLLEMAASYPPVSELLSLR